MTNCSLSTVDSVKHCPKTAYSLVRTINKKTRVKKRNTVNTAWVRNLFKVEQENIANMQEFRPQTKENSFIHMIFHSLSHFSAVLCVLSGI